MKLHFTTPFYSVSIILVLAAGCGQKAPAAEESGLATVVSPTPLHDSSAHNPPASLRTMAGKKGLSQKEIDSLENVSMLRKKF